MADQETQTQHNPKRQHEGAHEGAPLAAPLANGDASAGAAYRTIEIAYKNIVLPRRFRPGHVLDENQAKILDTAYQRQFANNQNANAEARAERFAKATTDAERAANAPLTAAEIVALYMDYEPAVGGRTRGGGLEALRQQMAWRFWTALVTDHNKSIKAGGPALIVKAGLKEVAIAAPPRKGKDQSDDAHKAAKDAFEADRTVFKTRLLEHGTYGPQIAVMVEAELVVRRAESGATKTDAVDVTMADESLL
jgi:hypothetical protein